MRRSKKGNLVLVIAVAVVVLILGYFALNYLGLLGTRKEAQTAADAAVLYVATELTSITIPSRVGVVGLVDLAPKDPSNPLFRTNPNNEAPVIGFNTALATLRLDTLIANDLQNADMQYLAEQDRLELIEVGKKLRAEIVKRVQTGGPIWTKAVEIYEQNNRRLGGPGALVKEEFKILVGRLDEGQGTTNCPLPTPDDGDTAAQANSTNGFYKSCVDIPVNGKSFVFAPTGDEPRLVDSNKFISVDDAKYGGGVFDGLPCAVAKIDAGNSVREFSNKSSGQTMNLQSVACAQVGSVRQKVRSTVYTVGFAGSFPSKDLLPSLTLESLLKFKDWGDPSTQQTSTWLKNGDKEYPGGTAGGVSLSETNFVQGRPKIESPSTALAYGLYDWLRSLRLRPNRTAVVAMIKGDDLRDNAEVKTFKANQESEDEEQNDPDDDRDVDEAAEVGDEDTVAAAELALETDDDESRDFTPMQGCVVNLDNGADPRFQALRDGTASGAGTYFDSFDYRGISEDQCPENALSFLVDPITGEPKGQAGNSIIELCQLVEGTVATNRAAFLSRLAGFEMVPDIQNARRILFNEVNRNVNRAQGDLTQATAAEGTDRAAARRADLVSSLNMLKSGLRNYMQTTLLQNSPLSSTGNPSPKGRAEEFLNVNIDSNNAKEIANRFLNGPTGFEQLVKIERHRLQGISRRARRMRINGRAGLNRTVRLVRRLRRFSARGIRRIDARLQAGNPVSATDTNGKTQTFQIPQFERKVLEVTNPRNGKTVRRRGVVVSGHTDSGVNKPSFDLFPEAPAFVVNIRRPGRSILGPGQGGGGASAKVVHIMPNNEPTIIRNNSSARPHFFSLDTPDRSQEDAYKAVAEGLQTDGFNDKVVVPQGKSLGSGNKFFPQNLKVIDPFRHNWDTFHKQNKNGYGPNTVVGRGTTGRAFLRQYTKANVFGNDRTGKDKRIEPFFLTLKQLRQLIREAQLGALLDEEDGNPEDFAPGFEQVFIISCDGDASFDKNNGNIIVSPVSKVNKNDPRYPFGTNSLLPQQFLYFNGQGLKDGPDAPGSKKPGPDPSGHPLYVQRSVIARDQFADLSKGSSYKLQPLQNWCKKDAPYELEIGSGSGECPYPAGEFRIGIPLSIACCKLDPDKLVVKFRRRDFPQVVDLPDPFGDDLANDPSLKNDDPDEEFEMCPPLIKQGGRTGKTLGFLN